MAGNADPIFSKSGDVSSDGTTGMAPTITTAVGDYTGASADYKLVFTADATNGGFIQRIRFKPAGTNIASLARIFINNGSANTTASNNSFYGDMTLPVSTASLTASMPELDYPLNIALPAGFRIYVGVATTVAAGWYCTPIAGKY